MFSCLNGVCKSSSATANQSAPANGSTGTCAINLAGHVKLPKLVPEVEVAGIACAHAVRLPQCRRWHPALVHHDGMYKKQTNSE